MLKIMQFSRKCLLFTAQIYNEKENHLNKGVCNIMNNLQKLCGLYENSNLINKLRLGALGAKLFDQDNQYTNADMPTLINNVASKVLTQDELVNAVLNELKSHDQCVSRGQLSTIIALLEMKDNFNSQPYIQHQRYIQVIPSPNSLEYDFTLKYDAIQQTYGYANDYTIMKIKPIKDSINPMEDHWNNYENGSVLMVNYLKEHYDVIDYPVDGVKDPKHCNKPWKLKYFIKLDQQPLHLQSFIKNNVMDAFDLLNYPWMVEHITSLAQLLTKFTNDKLGFQHHQWSNRKADIVWCILKSMDADITVVEPDGYVNMSKFNPKHNMFHQSALDLMKFLHLSKDDLRNSKYIIKH